MRVHRSTPARLSTTLAVLSAAALLATAPAHADAPGAATSPNTGAPGSETLTLYSGPGMGHQQVSGNGCHPLTHSVVNFAESEPIAQYTVHSGPECSGGALGSGRGETQWIPPLHGARSVAVIFED